MVGGGGGSRELGKGEVCFQDAAGSARSSRREKSAIPTEGTRREVALVQMWARKRQA